MPNSEQHVKLVAEISASSNGLISALKQASGAINDTTGDWKSKFSQLKDSTNLISQSVKNLSDLVKKVGDVDMDVDGIEKVNGAIRDVSQTFASVQKEVGAFTAELVAMKNAASELGMPVEEYQRFADAVKNAGMNMNEGRQMIESMKSNIMDLANGVPQAQEVFSKLGLSIEQLSSNTVAGNFDAIVQAMTSVIQPTEQARASMELFKTRMEQAVNVSQEYNKLLVQQTTNTYATDKDVQNSISLAGAIENLGKQLGTFATKSGDAAKENVISAKSFDELFEIIKSNKSVLGDMYVEYANYVDSLKRGVTSTLDAKAAVKALWEQVSQYKIYQKSGEKNDTFPTASLEQLLAFVTMIKDKIADEYTAIHGIMNQRMLAGAPIDTKELEEAMDNMNWLRLTLLDLKDIVEEQSQNGHLVAREDVENVNQLNNLLIQTEKEFKDIFVAADNENATYALEEVREKTKEFEKQIEEAQSALKKGFDFKLNTKDIDEARNKLEKLKETIDKSADWRRKGATSLMNIANGLKELDSCQNKIIEIQKQANSFGYKLRWAFKHPKDAVQELIMHMRLFSNEMDKAGQSGGKMGDDVKSQLQQIAGMLFGMGSKTAIAVKGFREIGTAIKMFLIDPFRKANEEIRKFQEYATKMQVSAADKQIKKYEELEEALKKYAESVKTMGQTGKESDRVKMESLQKEIGAKYGIDINPQNFEEVMAEKFKASLKQREAAIKSQIRAYEKLNEALEEEYKERDSYLTNDLGVGIEEKYRGKQRMVEIRNEQGENNERIMELREQLRMMGYEDHLEDYKNESAAEESDEEQKKFDEAVEKAKKALEDQKRALDGATSKLNEWEHSLDDSEREKNLRVIVQKYEEAVKGGVDETTARNVAVKAIAEMLKKEREEEDKKNAELLKAMDERIKQYKSAYKAYVEADKAIVDAKKSYARTQKELADEAKNERIAKRRERLQKAMSRFGFTPFEGFNLNESSSERRERRRNAQIDASIADKMAKAQAGSRVSWTRAEKERLSEFQRLQRKDKQLEAAQKQMEAADKQKKAAEQLQEAAKAIRAAITGRAEAGKNLKEAGKNLKEANDKRRTKSSDATAEHIFHGARKDLKAKGIGSATSQRQLSYNGQFETLHRDLQNIMKHTYFVK